VRTRALLCVLVGLAGLAACPEPTVVRDDVTGLEIVARFDAALGLDQIRVSGIDADGADLFAPGDVPEPPAELASGEESVVVLLDDTMGGTRVIVRVDGLASSAIEATGVVETTVQSGEVVRVEVELGDAAACGDGVIRALLETCDDGNALAADGCNARCRDEPGWTCTGEPSTCETICGDGAIGGDEDCDDGDTEDGDGCDASCELEAGFACTGEPSACASTCGDGLVASDEDCDDGDTDPNDGCSAACTVEAGFDCDGASPTSCTAICGDGRRRHRRR
jgi:cysteine-rich repeat protein